MIANRLRNSLSLVNSLNVLLYIFPFLSLVIYLVLLWQSVNQLTVWIVVDSQVELEKVVLVLWSLTIHAHWEINKWRAKKDEIENTFIHVEHYSHLLEVDVANLFKDVFNLHKDLEKSRDEKPHSHFNIVILE